MTFSDESKANGQNWVCCLPSTAAGQIKGLDQRHVYYSRPETFLDKATPQTKNINFLFHFS